jgi:DNA polymerase-4
LADPGSNVGGLCEGAGTILLCEFPGFGDASIGVVCGYVPDWRVMRPVASVLHLDLDAFFASVEQRDKPSLRGKPVIVGGVGGRGVVATASYEAREYGVRSAMSTREARSRCPHAAFLSGRFPAYRATSRDVMTLLRSVSPLVEPLSLDEAFVDLEASALKSYAVEEVRALAESIRRQVFEVTGGITASVGVGSSKFIAKIASELDKPDGLTIVPPGTEQELLRPMHVSTIPGVGPATAERLRRAGIGSIAELESVSTEELVRLVGKAQGQSLFQLARAIDNRRVEPERETKSISVEGTYDSDLTDRSLMEGLLTKQAARVAERLRKHGLSGRTVTIKVRLHDFTTNSRSTTLSAPTDNPATIARLARSLLTDLDTSGGVRLLGVGVSGLADWIQEDLFGEIAHHEEAEPDATTEPLPRQYVPGMDVTHRQLGPGWVWGSGRGTVTVRFETAHSPPGPVRSFRVGDPDLQPLEFPEE